MICCGHVPINYLVLLGHIEILGSLFDRVFVPASVWDEFHHPDAPPPIRDWCAIPLSWFERRSLASEPEGSLSYLGKGEREAIALAVEFHADRLLVDERPARIEALRRNIKVIGTLGILREAAHAGPINLPEVLSRLQQTTFIATPELIRQVLEQDEVRRKER
jgi:predicted nucleic acid-binding protein